jgi:hypothetical protein
MNNNMQYDGKFLLVVTYGRSGSTLLQGMLNTLEGYLIKGENGNLLHGLFNAYQNLVAARSHGINPGVNKPEHPWYGLDKLTEKRFFEHACSFATHLLFPELEQAQQYRCLGFKEIRYFDLLQQGGEQALNDYMDFLMRLFPGCKILFLSRDHQQVMSSNWWAQSRRPELLRADLEKFDQWADNYCLSHQDKSFRIHYTDMIEINSRLGAMFQFLDEKLDTQKIDEVLDVAHSYNTDFSKTRYAGLISRANHLYESSEHKNASKAFDKAVAYALEHEQPQRIVCTQRSSYKDYYVIAMDDPALAYFPVSKCACSTIKAWLMSIDHTRRTSPGLHQSLATDHDPHNYWGYNADLDLDKYQHHQKFAVIRDPLERFISFYTNFLDRIALGWFRENNSCDAYIQLTTDINDFVDYFCARPIHHYYILQHTMPQHTSLGEVFPSLDEIFTIKELGKAKEFLEDTFEMALPVLQENPSQSKHRDTAAVELSRASVEKLMRYYAQDYELLGNYFDIQEAADRYAR